VASIGNLEFSGHPYFNLTTVDECRTELGRQAANLLFRQIEANAPNVNSEQIRIKGSLITRQSTVGGNRILP
jgi:DNA-binding LacI/PurR family transcriptional regulator